METWRPIPGFDGYEASDLGRIRSVDRDVTVEGGFSRRFRGRVLKLQRHGGGYRRLRLGWHSKSYYVHQLVMLAFVGEPPVGQQVAHCNGEPTDNRLVNLRYDSAPGNNADKIRHGTHGRGEQCPTGRLTQEQVLEIRSSELARKLLAAQFGVSKSHIDNIKAGHRWGWL